MFVPGRDLLQTFECGLEQFRFGMFGEHDPDLSTSALAAYSPFFLQEVNAG